MMALGEEIIRIAARGDGVTGSGQYVSGAAPGDWVIEGEVMQRGAHYVEPPCKHFGVCGGCQLQHISDGAFANFCRDKIIEALSAHDIPSPEIRATHISSHGTRRRVGLKGHRRGKSVSLGLAERASHRIVDLRACPVMLPALFDLLNPLRRLLVHVVSDRKSVEVHLTDIDQGVEVLIKGQLEDSFEAQMALTDFAQEHALARLAVDSDYGAEARWEPEPATVTLSGVPVLFPAGSFLQATQDGEALLVSAVSEAVGEARSITDLFAGLGTFSLAIQGVEHAAEGTRSAIHALQSAANAAQIKLFCDHRDLFRRPMQAAELSRFDAVIIDPPRAGAKDQMSEIAQSKVSRVAAVSCNPSTFARDTRILVDGGFTLDWVQPVGQFRWSTHVELAAQFSR